MVLPLAEQTGGALARNQQADGQHAEPDQGRAHQQIAAGDKQTIPLQHAGGQQQNGPSGQGIGEGNGAKGQHQQQGGQHDQQAVAAVDGAAGGQGEQARADNAIDAGQQIRTLVQGRLELVGGKAALHQDGGQPGHPVEGNANADKEDQEAKRGTDAGDGDRQQEGDGEQHAKQ